MGLERGTSLTRRASNEKAIKLLLFTQVPEREQSPQGGGSTPLLGRFLRVQAGQTMSRAFQARKPQGRERDCCQLTPSTSSPDSSGPCPAKNSSSFSASKVERSSVVVSPPGANASHEGEAREKGFQFGSARAGGRRERGRGQHPRREREERESRRKDYSPGFPSIANRIHLLPNALADLESSFSSPSSWPPAHKLLALNTRGKSTA